MSDASTTAPIEATAAVAAVGPASPVHPLFYVQKPGEEEIELIGFTVERTYPDRPSEAAAKQFGGQEIADLQALADRFGGGTYVLKARNERGQMVKGGWRVHYVDEDAFPPKPMLRPARVAASVPASAAVAPAPAQQQQPSDLAAVIAAMNANSAAMVASIQAQSRESMAVVVQVLQSVVGQKTASTDDQVMAGAAMMMRLQSDADSRALERLTTAREMSASSDDDIGKTIETLAKGAAAIGPLLGKGDGK